MRPIPITLISGWLGSGKTTLLNRILADAAGRRIAVLQNEFGDIGLDGDLIEGNVAGLYELAGGCICCSVHDDFMAVLEEVVTLESPPESIVVETTGVADPSVPLVSILQHPDYGDRFLLDGVATLVDALNLESSLRDHPEVSLQIAAADLLLISKTDCVDPEELAEVRERLSRINPEALIEECRDGVVPNVDLLDLGGFDPDRLQVRSNRSHVGGPVADHSSGVGSLSFRCEGPMNFERLEGGLGEIFERWGANILRAKGIIRIQGVDPVLLMQGVRRRYSWQYGKGYDATDSRLVIIGRDLPGEEIIRILRGAVETTATSVDERLNPQRASS